MLIQCREFKTSYMHRTRLGKINIARPVNAQIAAVVDLSPDADAQFILGPNYIVGANGSQVAGRKCGWNIAEEACAVDGKQLTGCGSYKLLELGWRIRRQWLLLRLGAVPSAESNTLRRRGSRSFERSNAFNPRCLAGWGLLLFWRTPLARGRLRIHAIAGRALQGIDGVIPCQHLRAERRRRREHKQRKGNGKDSSHRCTLFSRIVPPARKHVQSSAHLHSSDSARSYPAQNCGNRAQKNAEIGFQRPRSDI